MYAVFQIGSKQYRISKNQIIYIERIHVKIGDHIEFDKVLFVKNDNFFQIGNPFIKNLKIVAAVLNHDLGNKIKIIKFRRRKHYRKSQGHRQHFTTIKIININGI